MSEDAAVDTPLWSCKRRSEFEQSLLESSRFFSEDEDGLPTLSVLSQRRVRKGVAAVQWQLGVEWPTMWSARVNILGETEVQLRPSRDGTGLLVVEAKETWHQTPSEVFWDQVTPRWRDLMSIYNAPTAEHMPLRTLEKRREYRVAVMPAGLAVQAEWLEVGDLLLQEQAPMPPSFCFTGQVKRVEWYSTVSPAIVERTLTQATLPGGLQQTAQRRRWIIPVPMRYTTDDITLPDPDGGTDEMPDCVVEQSVQYVRRPSQRLAMRRLRGPPSNKKVLQAAQEMVVAAERDGLKVVKQQGKPVIVQFCYDIKVGFNAKAMISMGVWQSVPSWLQHNEVGIVLED